IGCSQEDNTLADDATTIHDSPPRGPLRGIGQDTITLLTIALSLVSAATAWYLLKEFVTFLRPLMMAVFLCYVIIPIHLRLKQYASGIVSMFLIVGGSVAILLLLALLIQSSMAALIDDLPQLEER